MSSNVNERTLFHHEQQRCEVEMVGRERWRVRPEQFTQLAAFVWNPLGSARRISTVTLLERHDVVLPQIRSIFIGKIGALL